MRDLQSRYEFKVGREERCFRLVRPIGERVNIVPIPSLGGSLQAIKDIGVAAWINSSFLHQVSSRYYGVSTADLLNEAYGPRGSESYYSEWGRLNQSLVLGRRMVYWFGVNEADGEKQGLTDLRRDYYEQHGFINVERSESSHNRSASLAGKITGKNRLVEIKSLNVVPLQQRKGLATALAHTALGEQPKNWKTGFSAPEANRIIRAWGEAYGYEAVDQFVSDEIFKGIQLPMVRYEAPSVGEVLEAMESRKPWLSGRMGSTVANIAFVAGDIGI